MELNDGDDEGLEQVGDCQLNRNNHALKLLLPQWLAVSTYGVPSWRTLFISAPEQNPLLGGSLMTTKQTLFISFAQGTPEGQATFTWHEPASRKLRETKSAIPR